jgi:mannose-6-phosphate isomerase
MVWGGRRLGEVLGKPLPGSEPYGEAWEVSDHASHQSRVARGPLAGRSLRELMRHWREPLLGKAGHNGEAFPLLVKLLDASDWLSVQVHPSDDKVAQLWPGEGGKTEAWFILDAAPGSRVYAGLKPGVDAAILRQALSQGSVAECLHSFQPRPGDCLFLPAGTVHAVGGGVLMAEVQQTSDATFRLFDWNRLDASGKPRTLHLEQALACIDWERGPVEPVRARHYGEPISGPMISQPLVDCPYFAWEYLRAGEPFPCGGTGRLQVLTVVQGRGRLEGPHGENDLALGQTWVLPASNPRIWCRPTPTLGLLRATLPS